MKVLFIQEKPQLTVALEFMLKKKGHKINFCNNISQAESSILTDCPDAVVVDITAENCGLSFIGNIKKRNIPVVVLSTLENEDLQKALKKGADDFVQLPYSINELAMRISILQLQQAIA